MKFFLNPFITVVKGKDNYELFEKHISTDSFTKAQKAVFNTLIHYKGVEEKVFSKAFGNKILNEWLENDIISSDIIDRNGIGTRNASFYWNKELPDAEQRIRESSVMILGCGGLGTHMAWNMAALGVGTVHLVDYDVVEQSNLSRQILFGIDDLGKRKVEVLKDKLEKVNPNIHIVAHNMKIDSEHDLEALVQENHTDCIVKALDLPVYITQWIDNVCTKFGLKYVTGIMLGTSQMIGPTYNLGDSLKYNDFIPPDFEHNRYGGIAPSLGFIMYQMAGELSEEVFKILIGNDNLKYENSIIIHDNIDDTMIKLNHKKVVEERSSSEYNTRNMLNLLIIMLIYFAGASFRLNQFVIIGIALGYLVIGPSFMSKDENEAFQYGFISVCGMVLNNIITLLSMGQLGTIRLTTVPSMISILLILMSVICLALYFIYTVIFIAARKIYVRR